jgi:hypothetical protein
MRPKNRSPHPLPLVFSQHEHDEQEHDLVMVMADCFIHTDGFTSDTQLTGSPRLMTR